MPLASQYQHVNTTTKTDGLLPADDPLRARQWSSPVGRSATQVQQILPPNPNGCAQAWSDIFTMDIRFVGDLAVDHLRQRAIIVMQSASAEPSCIVPGADVFTLASWDSATPANFGGDGHGWWKVCYVVPDSGDTVDLSGVTGSLRFATWFTCSGDLPSGSGNYGDGVALLFNDDQEYSATFGSATASADVSMASLPLDATFLWFYNVFRSIDDITQDKTYHAFDTSIFNHDKTKVNEDFIPLEPSGGLESSIDWTTDDRNERDEAITYTMGTTIGAVAAAFPGACRVLATAFGADLRALCE